MNSAIVWPGFHGGAGLRALRDTSADPRLWRRGFRRLRSLHLGQTQRVSYQNTIATSTRLYIDRTLRRLFNSAAGAKRPSQAFHYSPRRCRELHTREHRRPTRHPESHRSDPTGAHAERVAAWADLLHLPCQPRTAPRPRMNARGDTIDGSSKSPSLELPATAERKHRDRPRPAPEAKASQPSL